jgi:photosystem II stability/assembly factor-like uncharacterized protein
VDYPIYKFISHKDNLYAAFYGAGIFKTSDEGKNWTACHTGLSNFLARDLVLMGNTLFVGTNRGGVFKSTDEGATWQMANDSLLNKDIWALFVVQQRLFAGTANGLFYTDNEGGTWQKAALPPPKAHHQIIFSLAAKGNHLLAGTNSHVYLSKDVGLTWEQIKVPTEFDIMTIGVQGDTWLLGTSAEGIIASEDGVNWEFWNKQSNNTRSLVLVEENIILASSLQGVMRINKGVNGSENINAFNEGLSNAAIKSIGYHQKKLYAGTYKQGIWRYDLPQSELISPSVTTQKHLSKVHLYPNPTSNGMVTIAYELTQDLPTRIDLFDSFGKQIAQISPLTEQYKGHHQISYDMNGITDGIYYFHIQIGTQKISKQVVVVR